MKKEPQKLSNPEVSINYEVIGVFLDKNYNVLEDLIIDIEKGIGKLLTKCEDINNNNNYFLKNKLNIIADLESDIKLSAEQLGSIYESLIVAKDAFENADKGFIFTGEDKILNYISDGEITFDEVTSEETGVINAMAKAVKAAAAEKAAEEAEKAAEEAAKAAEEAAKAAAEKAAAEAAKAAAEKAAAEAAKAAESEKIKTIDNLSNKEVNEEPKTNVELGESHTSENNSESNESTDTSTVTKPEETPETNTNGKPTEHIVTDSKPSQPEFTPNNSNKGNAPTFDAGESQATDVSDIEVLDEEVVTDNEPTHDDSITSTIDKEEPTIIKDNSTSTNSDDSGFGIGTAVGIGTAAAAVGGGVYGATKLLKNKKENEFYSDDTDENDNENITDVSDEPENVDFENNDKINNLKLDEI